MNALRVLQSSPAYCPSPATRNGETIFRCDLALNCATSFRGDKGRRPRAFILRASLLPFPARGGGDPLTDFRLIRIWPRGSGRPEVDREKLSPRSRLSRATR